MSKKGFSLIELVIFIVVAGIFVPLTYIAFSSAMKQGKNPENVTTDRLNTEQVIELTVKQIQQAVPFPATIPSFATCGGIAGCAVTATYQTFNGSSFSSSGSATNYILITVTVNGFTTSTLVTNHGYL